MYDFLYLPHSCRTRGNLGYAFINFSTAAGVLLVCGKRRQHCSWLSWERLAHAQCIIHCSMCVKPNRYKEFGTVCSGKKLGLETARRGWGLPREGVVAEKFVPSLESLSSLGLEQRNLGCAGNFAGISRTPGGVQKVCEKSTFAFFVPYLPLAGSLCVAPRTEKSAVCPPPPPRLKGFWD